MLLPITNGQVQIDEADLELVSQYKWHKNDAGYAVWRGIKDGNKQTIRMHRLIMQPPDDMVIDHINRNPLDNRRCNLRICTQSENMQNKDKGKGYWFHKQNNNWCVELKSKHVAAVSTESEAIELVAFIRAGGTYVKPVVVRTHCNHGHSLEDAYKYGYGLKCRTCQAIRGKAYFERSYVAKPKIINAHCARGHDRSLYKTVNGDCRECVKIRSQKRRLKV